MWKKAVSHNDLGYRNVVYMQLYFRASVELEIIKYRHYGGLLRQMMWNLSVCTVDCIESETSKISPSVLEGKCVSLCSRLNFSYLFIISNLIFASKVFTASNRLRELPAADRFRVITPGKVIQKLGCLLTKIGG